MAGAFFFSVGTIGLSTREGRKPSTLLKAASHNRRQIQAELGAKSYIDSTRSHLNETIAGPNSPAGVVALAQGLMADAGVVPGKLRKDHAQAVELLFSLAPDTTVDTGEYFRRCVAWASEQFGSVNILSADIHRDEAAPHLHILVLPLVAGRMCGSGLITRPRLAKLRVPGGQGFNADGTPYTIASSVYDPDTKQFIQQGGPQGMQAATPNANGVHAPTTKAEYDQLPKGAKYTHPDGTTRTKG